MRLQQDADATAKAVTGAQTGGQAQRQEVPEEEELAQAKALQQQEVPEEEELAQTKALQRQGVPRGRGRSADQGASATRGARGRAALERAAALSPPTRG